MLLVTDGMTTGWAASHAAIWISDEECAPHLRKWLSLPVGFLPPRYTFDLGGWVDASKIERIRACGFTRVFLAYLEDLEVCV